MLAELRSDRVRVALGVYPRKLLAPDDRLRTLPYVCDTPCLGHVVVGSLRIGGVMADEITQVIHGEPSRHEILVARLTKMS